MMRYSIYFTPPADHPLTVRAASWLGRDAFRNLAIEQFEVAGFAADALAELTADPRRYGFHATLKAPMELAVGRNEHDLLAAFDTFALKTRAFEIPKILLGQLGPFFALVPAETYDPLQAFAAACVRDFEPFRASLSDADIARRKPQQLSETERANLMQWGYPYVFDDFRFHMTLTGPVPAERQEDMRAALEPVFADHVDRPLAVSHVSLFIEAERGAPFVMKRILPLRL